MKKITIFLIIISTVNCSNKAIEESTIPPGIATPNIIETHFGKLTLFDGVTKKESIEKVYEHLDIQRAVNVYLNNISLASINGMKRGILEIGQVNKSVIIYEDFLDSRTLFLTPNSTSVYFTTWLELKPNQAMVIETPPNVLGFINNYFFRYVTDFGNVGPDEGNGGKFLILPPDYTGEIPKGYYVVRTETYNNWIIGRGFAIDGDPKPAVESIKKTFRLYPLGSQPNEMEFINGSDKGLNTINFSDDKIYKEINEVIQSEPIDNYSTELLGELQSIGIVKGKQFNPDARMKKILKEAANIAVVTARTLIAYPRDKEYYIYTNSTSWSTLFVGNYDFKKDYARSLDARIAFHFYATGITPAMVMKFIGKGSQYTYSYTDKDGNIFDGGNTYKIKVPTNVPVKDYWSFTIYDSQTRSMLRTEQPFATVNSYSEKLVINKDGSYDIYFGPIAPKGFEENWIQTIPGKNWNVLFRLYGPLEPWFDKTWQLSDPILIK